MGEKYELAKLTDLPSELTLQIIDDLDNDSTCQLSMVCKSLHRLALSAFFHRNNVPVPSDNGTLKYSKKCPPQTLPAFRIALFVKTLKEVLFEVNPNVNRLFNDILSLRGLLMRLPSIETVVIDFVYFDHWLNTVFSSPHRLIDAHGFIDPTIWKFSFTSLLDTILDRGCTSLNILGSDRISEMYIKQYPSLPPLKSIFLPARPTPQEGGVPQVLSSLPGQVKPLFKGRSLKTILKTSYSGDQGVVENTSRSSLNQRLRLSEAAQLGVTSPNPKGNTLKEFFIVSEMLLQSHFYTWTKSSLQANAATLTRLSLKSTCPSSAPWAHFLQTLNFPVLSDFSILSKLLLKAHSVKFRDLGSFLGRHPSIQRLQIEGISVDEKVPSLKAPILPNLIELSAHPKHIRWLLGPSNSFPGLNSVTVSSQIIYSPKPFNYDDFDDALDAIARRKHVVLHLRFSVYTGLLKWLKKHIASGPEKSVIGRLQSVTYLVIDTAWHLNFADVTMDVFPSWFSLFPNLDKISFENYGGDTTPFLPGSSFLEMVVERCPSVTTLSLNDQAPLRFI